MIERFCILSLILSLQNPVRTFSAYLNLDWMLFK